MSFKRDGYHLMRTRQSGKKQCVRCGRVEPPYMSPCYDRIFLAMLAMMNTEEFHRNH